MSGILVGVYNDNKQKFYRYDIENNTFTFYAEFTGYPWISQVAVCDNNFYYYDADGSLRNLYKVNIATKQRTTIYSENVSGVAYAGLRDLCRGTGDDFYFAMGFQGGNSLTTGVYKYTNSTNSYALYLSGGGSSAPNSSITYDLNSGRLGSCDISFGSANTQRVTTGAATYSCTSKAYRALKLKDGSIRFQSYNSNNSFYLNYNSTSYTAVNNGSNEEVAGGVVSKTQDRFILMVKWDGGGDARLWVNDRSTSSGVITLTNKCIVAAQGNEDLSKIVYIYDSSTHLGLLYNPFGTPSQSTVALPVSTSSNGWISLSKDYFDYIESVDPVTANVPSGSVELNTEIELSTDTTGATIYYTTNGNEPTESSTEYEEPITITEPVTIKAKAYKTDYLPSDIATFTYDILTVSDVESNKLPGSYPFETEVILTTQTSGAIIYYTLNGTDPTTESQIYLDPIKLEVNPTTIKAKAFKTNYYASNVSEFQYQVTDIPVTIYWYSNKPIVIDTTSSISGSRSLKVISDHNPVLIKCWTDYYNFDFSSVTSVTTGMPTTGCLGLWVKVNEPEEIQDLNIRIGTDEDNYLEVNARSYPINQDYLEFANEFRYYVFRLSTGILTGTVDWENINYFEIRFLTETGIVEINIDLFTASKSDNIGANCLGDRRGEFIYL